MEGTLAGEEVRVGPPARERFYDSRGYGRPRGDALDLARVEAAHLLYRGDLEAVDGQDFREFLAAQEDIVVSFLVYKDLRDRGFYVSPVRDGWVENPRGDLVAYERGSGPWDGAVAHRIRVVGERTTLPARDLGDSVLAVVDEESEITYLETSHPDVDGDTGYTPPSEVEATLLGDRVICWHPPASLHERGFYGQPLDDDGALQLSLLEAAYLAERDAIALDADAVVERGRAVEGERFDRRLAVYRTLRERGVVPKTGFKFGADFRTYAEVESVENLGHSELLVRVVSPDRIFEPRDLSLDVRLAHGVRKQMVFALVRLDDLGANDGADAAETPRGDADITWLAVERLTP